MWVLFELGLIFSKMYVGEPADAANDDTAQAP